MNTSIFNHIKLACLIFRRDCLVSVAVPMEWPTWADVKFWEMTERIEMLRGEVCHGA